MQFMLFGLVTGSILLLGAVGFSMTMRVDNFLNIAHGQILALGAYLGYYFNNVLKMNIVPAAFIAIVLTIVIGLLMHKICILPIRHYGPLYLLFTSVGLSYIIHGSIEAIAGCQPKTYSVPISKAIMVGGKPLISMLELIVIIVAVVSALLLHILLTQTKVGKAIRATSSNYDLALVRGINTTAVSRNVWIISCALGGLAGILSGLIGSIYTDMGWAQVMGIMSAAVVGGLGSIYGVMIGALLIGLAMDTSVILISASYRPAIAFLMVIVVLFLKPDGIFGGSDS
jgi:branched-subunit amino acid ABC-type transport system permease component